MLRLGAAQVKQVAHPAPNENPSRPPAMAGRDVATLYMTCRAFMRRNADAPGVRCASSCGSARACLACGPFHRSVVAGSDPCSFHLHITFRFRAAFGARIISFSCADPERGGRRSAARRTLGLRSRWRGAMPRWRHAAIPVRAGRRPSALHRGDFRPRDHASTPAVPTGSALRLARRPDHKTRPTGSRTSRAAVRFRQPRDATPRSVCRIVSGDAPPERGANLMA